MKDKGNRTLDFFKTILWAIGIATIAHWGIFEPSNVPSGSMENSIMTGDTIIISKMHYGPRTPITPLQIPLTHQEEKLTGFKSYSSLIQLPSFRLPGFSKIKRGDIIVFNVVENRDIPVDMRIFFVKRCIGMPGDTISSVDDDIFINGQKLEDNKNILYNYFIVSTIKIGDKWFEKNEINEYREHLNGFIVSTTKENIEKISKYKYIKIAEKLLPRTHPKFLEKFSNYNTIYNFDPIKIPYKGMEIDIKDGLILKQYFETIVNDLPNHKIQTIQNKLVIDDKEVSKYVFKKDYYFMMGDNRHNSNDSRYWGFVPEDYISGKAICVAMSIDKNKSGFNHIRWDRCFKILY